MKSSRIWDSVIRRLYFFTSLLVGVGQRVAAGDGPPLRIWTAGARRIGPTKRLHPAGVPPVAAVDFSSEIPDREAPDGIIGA